MVFEIFETINYNYREIVLLRNQYFALTPISGGISITFNRKQC